jgi:anti-anti-sigma factor
MAWALLAGAAKEPNMRIIRLDGDMDAAAMADMKDLFEELAACGQDVRLDMRNVSFIDSSGIGGIVFLFKRLKAQGLRLETTRLKGQPQRLFLHLDLAFLIAPDEPAEQA